MPTPNPEDVIIVGPDDIVDRDRDPGQSPAAETFASEIGPDPAVAAAAPKVDPNVLLQSLASGATDPMSLLLSQISANASDNPTVGMLTSFLQRRDPSPAPEVDEEAQAEAEARLDDLNTMVDKLYAEVEALRSRSVELAAALGACFVCFGSDLLCPRCGGRGRPGSRPPKPEAYRAYVVPAVTRVRRIAEAERRDNLPPPRPVRPPADHYSDQGANNG